MARTYGGRLFVGIALPEPTTKALQKHLRLCFQDGELPGRVVPPENWHFTLRFLGETSEEEASEIGQALANAFLGNPFHIQIKGVGAFPSLHRAKALWLGVSTGREDLVSLADAVHESLLTAGHEKEMRPFKPHLTLRRFKRSEDMRETAKQLGGFSQPMGVDELCLFRSHLGHGPPRYEILARFPLGH